MTDIGLRALGIRSRFLQISSSNDIHVDSKVHNPADFEVSMPNSIGSHDIIRVVPHTVSVPRMFFNVYEPSNRFILWRRKTKVIDLGNNYWNVTAEAQWIPTLFTVPPGIYTIRTLASTLNLITDLAENVSFYVDNGEGSSLDVLHVYGPYVMYGQWGYVNQPDSQLAPPPYIPQMFLTEATGSHFFDVLGLGGAQFVSNGPNWLSFSFDEKDVTTADSIRGTPIEQSSIIVPLFRTDSHDMGSYLTQYEVPNLNPYNLEGPLWVNVVVEELGDNSTVDTESGKPSSVVACIPVCDVPIRKYATRVVRDCDAEGIQYSMERSIRSFRVRCEDPNGNTLHLPRNWPVLLRLQILQSA